MAANHKEFLKAAKKVEKLMGPLHGESLQRIPKGFDCEHPAADLIKRKQWVFWQDLDLKLATSTKLLPEIVQRFRAMAPVVEMLNQPLLSKGGKGFSR